MKQRVLSIVDGALVKLAVEAPGALRWASWNRKDGTALLAGDHGSLFEYSDGAFKALTSGTVENLRCVDVHPDGGFAYACGNSGTILRVEGGSGKVIQSEARESLRRLAWNNTGGRALVVGNGGAAYTLSPGGELARASGAETNLRSIAWSPKEDAALVAGNCFRDSIGGLTPSPNLFELRGTTLNEISDLEGSRADLTSASWRPDGSTCLLAGFDQTWHTSTLISYSHGSLTEVKWGEEKLFPTACSWNPSGSYALIGTSLLTAEEGSASIYRYDQDGSIRIVDELAGYGASCIAWNDERTALVTCSRHVRAFSS
jgi:WD40 repeat protein